MPQIETWPNFPRGIRDHLVERMRDRNISLDDLNQLRLWIESRPNVPEQPWYNISGLSSYVVKGSFPRHFSLLDNPRLA